MDTQRLQEALEDFARERDWNQFHSPKNLAMALSVEASELLEHFQWLTPEQSADLDTATRDEVAEEIADVQIYLLRLADKLSIDLETAVQEKMEKNIWLLLIILALALSVGGLVEIVPLFALTETTEPVEGVDKYSALGVDGRDIYVREGCYTCHSQMIRPMRAEVERYGHYSLAAESQYDHPFQWGSKRTGPDLARVGGKYSNDWHVQHLVAPRSARWSAAPMLRVISTPSKSGFAGLGGSISSACWTPR